MTLPHELEAQYVQYMTQLDQGLSAWRLVNSRQVELTAQLVDACPDIDDARYWLAMADRLATQLQQLGHEGASQRAAEVAAMRAAYETEVAMGGGERAAGFSGVAALIPRALQRSGIQRSATGCAAASLRFVGALLDRQAAVERILHARPHGPDAPLTSGGWAACASAADLHVTLAPPTEAIAELERAAAVALMIAPERASATRQLAASLGVRATFTHANVLFARGDAVFRFDPSPLRRRIVRLSPDALTRLLDAAEGRAVIVHGARLPD